MNPMADSCAEVRVRFAPSPTGYLHIGGLRTALFNWLFARHHGGKFFVRIEDTDLQRSRQEYITSILQSLAWVGIESDEPPAMQTDGLTRHLALVQQLLAQGKAYRCYCLKIEYVGDRYAKYDGRCRDRAPQSGDSSEPYAIRLKIPTVTQAISFNDLIRGTVSFDIDQLDDFIIVRSDGVPVYNFVVVADDIEMQISHVIRGEEHISNTPRQLFIYQALEQTPPFFAHLPMILGPSGSKLSKREGATSVLEYRIQGYLSDALCNYLVRLGWSHGDQEIFTRQEMIQYFTLQNVGSKGAIFDTNKLDWVNSVYMRNTDATLLLNKIVRDIDSLFIQKLEKWSVATITALIELYKDRVKTLVALINEIVALYIGEKPADLSTELRFEVDLLLLEALYESLETIDDFTPEKIKEHIKKIVDAHNTKLAAVAQPLRVAITGKNATPGIFDLLYHLGKTESLRRLRNFIHMLKK